MTRRKTANQFKFHWQLRQMYSNVVAYFGCLPCLDTLQLSKKSVQCINITIAHDYKNVIYIQTSEKSFSNLKRIKTYLRNIMLQVNQHLLNYLFIHMRLFKNLLVIIRAIKWFSHVSFLQRSRSLCK